MKIVSVLVLLCLLAKQIIKSDRIFLRNLQIAYIFVLPRNLSSAIISSKNTFRCLIVNIEIVRSILNFNTLINDHLDKLVSLLIRYHLITGQKGSIFFLLCYGFRMNRNLIIRGLRDIFIRAFVTARVMTLVFLFFELSSGGLNSL